MDFKTDANELRKALHKKAIESPKYAKLLFQWIESATSDYTNTQAIGLWIGAIMTGVIAVVYARAFKIIESFSREQFISHPQYLFISSPALLLLAWWIVDKFAPEASGSGIPQVMSAIDIDHKTNKSFVDRLLSFKTIAIKFFSSLLCVAGGGAIGREGPTLQISASIFYLIGKFTRKFFPNSDEKTFIIAGAAAGLASAFNTPLGGIVYAIEELGMRHFHRVRTALLSAVIISGLVAQTLIGSYLYLGFPRLETVTSKQWPIVILVGAMTGLSGGLFSRMLLFLVEKRKKITSRKKLAISAIICGLSISTLIFFQPLSHGSGSELISDILFNGQIASVGLAASRFFGTIIAYLSGAAGGIFSPSLSIGACIGSKLAFLFNSGNANLFAMLGMVGFLTGVTHTPFTSFILVMEMSDRHSAVFPLMLTALIAQSTAKSVQSKSFYESIRDNLLAGQKSKSETKDGFHESTSAG